MHLKDIGHQESLSSPVTFILLLTIIKYYTILLMVYCFQLDFLFHFYRAMHFSAKRGIAIACRLSVTIRYDIEEINVDSKAEYRPTA